MIVNYPVSLIHDPGSQVPHAVYNNSNQTEVLDKTSMTSMLLYKKTMVGHLDPDWIRIQSDQWIRIRIRIWNLDVAGLGISIQFMRIRMDLGL